MKAARIGLVCINFHSARATIRLFESLRDLDNRELARLIVVDNSSGSTEYEQLRQILEPWQVVVLKAPYNLGYFGGAAWALGWLRSNGCNPQWLIVSNPDVSIPQPQFFVRLLQISPEAADVIAPAIIIEGTGTDQNPFMRTRISHARLRVFRWIYSHYPVSVAYQCLAATKRIMSRVGRLVHERRALMAMERDIYAPHGAFVIFGAKYLQRAHLNPPGFLFGEEIFVGEMCRRHGLRVVYRPDLRVLHKCHETTGIIKSRRMVRFLKESFDALEAEFFSGEQI